MNREDLGNYQFERHLEEYQFMSRSECIYLAIEIAFKDRAEGMNERDFLLKRMSHKYKDEYINWGIAVSMYACRLYFLSKENSKEMN